MAKSEANRLAQGFATLPSLSAMTSIARSSAGAYIRSAYSLTIRRAEKRGATVRIASLTTAIQRCGTWSAVAIVEGRHDFFFEQTIERVGVRGVDGVGCRRCAAFDHPAVGAVVSFGPPPVADAQMRHAVDARPSCRSCRSLRAACAGCSTRRRSPARGNARRAGRSRPRTRRGRRTSDRAPACRPAADGACRCRRRDATCRRR